MYYYILRLCMVHHLTIAQIYQIKNRYSGILIGARVLCNIGMIKDLFYRWQNVSNSTLYPDVLKIKTNCCETKFYKNAICLLFTNFQIHHLATLLPGRPSHRVARYGFINKKMAFLKNFVWQQSLFCFQNIWIQCRIRHILSTLKQILGA